MRHLKRKLVIFSIFALTSLSFSSCNEKDEIVFNQKDMEALDIEYRWAVISTPYVACRESPSYESKVSKNLRKGALEKIIGEKTVKVESKDENRYEKWYAISDGWIPENAVNVYLNRLRAEKAIEESL